MIERVEPLAEPDHVLRCREPETEPDAEDRARVPALGQPGDAAGDDPRAALAEGGERAPGREPCRRRERPPLGRVTCLLREKPVLDGRAELERAQLDVPRVEAGGVLAGLGGRRKMPVGAAR